MGVSVEIFFARDETIEAILRDPPKVWLLVSRDDPSFYAAAAAKAALAQAGWMEKLDPFSSLRRKMPVEQVDADALLPLDRAAGEGESVCLDKAWGGIDNILAAEEHNVGRLPAFLGDGGRRAGKIEVGYGVPRAFSSAETADIARTVAGLDSDAVSRRIALSLKWDLETYFVSLKDPEQVAYVLEFFDVLRDGLNKAAARRLGMVIVAT